MARFIGNVDPTASPVNYKSVFDLRAQYKEQAAGNWPTGAADVEIKCWGAGGAGGYWNGGSAGSGGAGGWAKGTTPLAAGTTLYIVVGGAGGIPSSNNDGSVAANAGGNGSANKYGSHRGGIGGGYSGVFTGSSTSDVSQANALVIAGGGGGGSSYDRSGEDESGGGGGGTTGGAGVNSPNGGGGGTQSAGGSSADGDAGTALKGGNAASSESTSMAAGGAGGGYFGGGAGSITGGDGSEEAGGGGGGSGYVKSGLTNTANLAGDNGAAGSTTGQITAIHSTASSDSNYTGTYGKGGGFNSAGSQGYVVIIDGAGANTFTSSQSYTIR